MAATGSYEVYSKINGGDITVFGMMFRLFGKKTSKTKVENKEITPEERIKQLHGKIMYILYVSLIVKVYAAFFPSLNFLSGVILAVFLFLELFFLSPRWNPFGEINLHKRYSSNQWSVNVKLS